MNRINQRILKRTIGIYFVCPAKKIEIVQLLPPDTHANNKPFHDLCSGFSPDKIPRFLTYRTTFIRKYAVLPVPTKLAIC